MRMPYLAQAGKIAAPGVATLIDQGAPLMPFGCGVEICEKVRTVASESQRREQRCRLATQRVVALEQEVEARSRIGQAFEH